MNGHTAKYWKTEGSRIICTLCPHNCRLREGATGVCNVRKNDGGKLITMNYGCPSALAVDPVEKKPLYHFLPGSSILSLGTYGCNLSCDFCQNHDISMGSQPDNLPFRSPADIVNLALQQGTPSIAFTYNEPVIFAEYLEETASIAHEKGLRTVTVTNGFISKEHVRTVFADIDAANVDLKSFSPDFYRKICGGSLTPVLETLRELHDMGIHLEITTLIIDGYNSGEDELKTIFTWIRDELSPYVPVHLSAFYPHYKMSGHPPTQKNTLVFARKLANDLGLPYVYLGNVPGVDNDTRCRQCRKPLIRRTSYQSTVYGKGLCDCGCDNRIIYH